MAGPLFSYVSLEQYDRSFIYKVLIKYLRKLFFTPSQHNARAILNLLLLFYDRPFGRVNRVMVNYFVSV